VTTFKSDFNTLHIDSGSLMPEIIMNIIVNRGVVGIFYLEIHLPIYHFVWLLLIRFITLSIAYYTKMFD